MHNVNGRTTRHRLAHAADCGGDAILGMQTAREFIHIGSRRCDEQAARGLRVVQRI